jgi:leader peptidase (prepilin peptidase)/N-methyltransferase
MLETLSVWVHAWPFGVFIFLVGLAVGSFLNVCIHRLPAGKSLVWPGSHCPKCLAPIAWYDNLPVVGYFALGGRCRSCRSPFSIRYAVVELAAGLMLFGYWLAYFRLGIRDGADHMAVYLVHMVLACSLVVSGVIDYERKEIYTSVTNFALGVAIVASFLWPQVQRVGVWNADAVLPEWTGWARADAVLLSLVGATVGGGIIYLTGAVGTLAFKREAMGLGDVYLMAAVGAALGWSATVLVFFVAPVMALGYAIPHAVRQAKAAAEEVGDAAPAVDPPPKVPMLPVAGTVLALGMLLLAGAGTRLEWGGSVLAFVIAGLAAFGASFWLVRRHENALAEKAEEESQAQGREPAPDDDAREVPYGPFLGMAAGVVMLVQDWALEYFRPGVDNLVRMIIGQGGGT